MVEYDRLLKKYEKSINEGWGNYGINPPCFKLLKLREFLEENEISISTSHSSNGWVDISCGNRTYEETLFGEFEVE